MITEHIETIVFEDEEGDIPAKITATTLDGRRYQLVLTHEALWQLLRDATQALGLG